MFLNEQSAGEISYELQDLAFCFSVLEVPDDICALTSSITARLSEVEKCKVGVTQDMPAYIRNLYDSLLTRTRIVMMALKPISVMCAHIKLMDFIMKRLFCSSKVITTLKAAKQC
jgi:hypothetical protein